MFKKRSLYRQNMGHVDTCTLLGNINKKVRFCLFGEIYSMWPGFKSQCLRHMWVEFVVGSLLCSERFFSGYSGFPLSSKTHISKFQFDQVSGRRRTTLWMCYLQIIIYLLVIGTIYLVMLLKPVPLNFLNVNSNPF